MSARVPSSITLSTLAVLIGLAAQLPAPAIAQQNGYLAMKTDASICVDRSLPPAKRIPSCTAIINLAAQQGSSAVMTRVAGVIYVSRASAFQQQGDDRAALQDFQAAVRTDPRSELPWLGLGNFYMAKSNYSRALQSFDQALKIAPQDPVAYDDRGAALVALHRNDDAVADFTRALAFDHQDTIALSNRATVYLRSNQPRLAIADLTVVIGEKPTDAQALYNRGTAYESTQALDNAMADYRNAARLEPAFAPAYEGLARILAKKNPQAALDELTDAIRRNPHSSLLLRDRGILYLSMRQFDRALGDFNQAIGEDDSDNIAYLDRGVAEQELGNLKMALADYTRSIALENTSAALVDRGSLYARLGEYDRALVDFEAALASEPRNVVALLGQANADYALAADDPRQLAASVKDYTQVIEAAPNNAAAYFMRGNVHFDLKEYESAYSDYSQSLRLDPNQPAALYNRSLAAERLGRGAEAARDRRAEGALEAATSTGGAAASARNAQVAMKIEYAGSRSTAGSAGDAPSVGFAAPRAAPADSSLNAATRADAANATTAAPKQEVTITGYRRVVSEGQVRFCRTDTTIGSRARQSTVCLTRQQLEAEAEAKDRLIRQAGQWGGANVVPSICGGAMGGVSGSTATSCYGLGAFGGPGPSF